MQHDRTEHRPSRGPFPSDERLKKKRLRFTTRLHLLFFKAISEAGARVAPRIENSKLMQKEKEIMVTTLPAYIRETCLEPSWKTCNDHFDLIAKQRRETDHANRNKSGISEEQSELGAPLDDLLLQRDEMEEKRREEKDAKTALDKRLKDAGNEMRDNAKARMAK